MQNKRRIAFIALALLLVAVLLVLLFRKGGPKQLDWRETYNRESRAPYGTSILFALLQDYFQADSMQVLQDSIKGVLPERDVNAAYLFVGEALYMDSLDQEQLLRFVEAGNTAFLSSKTLPKPLAQAFYSYGCEASVWQDYGLFTDSLARLNFYHPDLRRDSAFEVPYLYYQRLANYEWSHLEPYHFCDDPEGFTALGGYESGAVNFARHPYGKGYFYLHTSPLAFSNIRLLEESGLVYAERALTHLAPQGPAYWDAYSKVPEWMGRRTRNRSLADRSLSSESPLSYILSQPPLAWAWYLLLSMGLLFLLFRAKRRQRVMPVLEANTNTSLEFLSTIGRLYFLQNNHRKLALQQMKLFLAHVRNRYFLATHELSDAFVRQLAAKSEVPEAHLQQLMTYYRNIESSSFVSSRTLVEFHRLIEDFYQQTK